MATTPESAVTAYGWELHFTGGSSDKYYRVLLIDTVALVNYGRRGTYGQFIAHCGATPGYAQDQVRSLTNAKAAKGYQITRDLTEFTVDPQRARALTSLPAGTHRSPDARACTHVVAHFKCAADQQGTVSGDAAW